MLRYVCPGIKMGRHAARFCCACFRQRLTYSLLGLFFALCGWRFASCASTLCMVTWCLLHVPMLHLYRFSTHAYCRSDLLQPGSCATWRTAARVLLFCHDRSRLFWLMFCLLYRLALRALGTCARSSHGGHGCIVQYGCVALGALDRVSDCDV